MSFDKHINTKIENLWDDFFSDDERALYPLLFPSLTTKSLLFVGCNPSFSEKGFRKIFKETDNEGLNIQDFFLWKNKSNEFIERTINIEVDAKEKHDYFKRFYEISKEAKLSWEHIDLFFVRETNQGNLKKQIFDGRRLNEFALRQLDISKELISCIDPKVIVVVNAFASDIFQRSFECIFNDDLGCHFIGLGNKNIPVFFSSMFTGQRALDKGSFSRLKWHIKKVVGQPMPAL